MQLALEELASLPLMSWCARVRRGGTITVRHGAGVETRSDRFVEGAWDGDFDVFDVAGARTLAGSGAVLRDGACVFAAPFHPLERLFVLPLEDETLVSNSLVFVLCEGGDGLDLNYPNYYFDLVRQARSGIASQPDRMRTGQGRQVEVYRACRLTIDADLRRRWEPMPLGPPPENYAQLFELLLGTVQRVFANAAAAGRKKIYTPVAACSKGYDSTASAALARLAGCKEGITFARSGRAKGHPLIGTTKGLSDDSGAESLRALGMQVTERDRLDLQKIPGHPKAELFFRPLASTDASELVMEDKLAGSVFVSGRHAERYWGPTTRCKRRHFREVDDVNLSGHAYGEFRARVGFVHFPVPYIGALHGPALYHITHSEEMRPWRLGTGYYDRPIARRIAEEAGVPRALFGHVKRGSSEEAKGLGPESERDFLEFLESEIPANARARLSLRSTEERYQSHVRLSYFRTHYAHWPLVSSAMDLLGTERMHRLWGSAYLYVFHWGFEKMRGRYRVT